MVFGAYCIAIPEEPTPFQGFHADDLLTLNMACATIEPDEITAFRKASTVEQIHPAFRMPSEIELCKAISSQ